MNKERLLAMADFLETKVPKSQFNFGTVCEPKDWADLSPPPKRLSKGCGSIGCVVGWAPSLPALKQEGWYYDYWALIDGKGKSHDYISAGAKMFDITYAQSNALFTPGGAPAFRHNLGADASPKQLANLIRRFVRENSKPKPKAKPKIKSKPAVKAKAKPKAKSQPAVSGVPYNTVMEILQEQQQMILSTKENSNDCNRS